MAKLRMVHASRLGQKTNVGNSNDQLRIAMPPWVAHAKPPGPTINNIIANSLFIINRIT